MSSPHISYDEVQQRLREAEDVVEALLSSQVDAIVSQSGVQFLRLQETDRALHAAKTSLEQLLEQRTRELAASENRFRALLESASEAVIAAADSGRIIFVNGSAERMFGYPRQELIGAVLHRLIPGLPPDTGAAGNAAIRLSGSRRDGSAFPAEVRLSSSESNGERLTLALVTDISDRERMEARLRDAQKLESVGLLAGSVAHDFNNLLTAILGNASLLTEQVSETAQPQVSMVISGAEKAAQVARQLLAYAGKGTFQIAELDVSALLRENAELIRVSVPRSIAIALDLPEGLPKVQADPGQLQQVVMNLVINASEAIGEAPGRISLATAAADRGAHTELPPGRYVRVTVSDTGSGMDDATRARIFDPFFTTKVRGRGLGLSAVLGILRACGATIDIDSAPGKGTTFTLLFPAVDSTPRPPEGLPDCSATARTGTILIVDDEDGVRSFAAAALKRAGYSVLEAAQGREAVDLVRTGISVDLLLLDVTMPVMGGPEALRHIRQSNPDVPVVVTSGYSSEEVRRMMLAAGEETGFLPKPFTPRQLMTCVDAAFSRRPPRP